MKFNISIVFFISILSLVLSADTTIPALDTETTEPITTVSDETITTISSEDEETIDTEPPTDTTVASEETSTEPQTDTTETSDETTTLSSQNEETVDTQPPTTTTSTTTTASITTITIPSLADNIYTSTQNFLGINCVVNAIYNVEDVTSNFEFEIELCGSRVKKHASFIFDEIENLEQYSKNVENVNKKICKNRTFSLDKDTKNTPSAQCIKNFKRAVLKLNKSLNKTKELVEAYQYQTTSSCAKMSLLKFRLKLNNFDAAIKECASIATS